jgi:cell division protein FtsI (penicillin-binding protein 3)
MLARPGRRPLATREDAAALAAAIRRRRRRAAAGIVATTPSPQRATKSGTAVRVSPVRRPRVAPATPPRRAVPRSASRDAVVIRPGLAAVRRPNTGLVPRKRLVALLLAVFVGFAAVAARLAWVQGVSAQRYAAIGVSQRTHTIALSADRGSIFDRNGNELAISVPQTTVWADPHLVEDPRAVSQALAGPLAMDPAVLLDHLTRPEHFVYLARRIDDATAATVKALQLKGVFFLSEPKRFSPDGTLAASVLGTVGTDNEGLSGVEVGYDKSLAGQPGSLTVEQDPSGRDLPGGERQIHPSARGSDLVLTLDRSLQYETEQDLAAEIVNAKALGGMAAIMDAGTGEVLAMASLVAGANPGDPPQAAPSNEVVTRVYEPGSVNKLVTVSAALQEGITTPGQIYNVPDSVRVADQTFHDDNPHPAYNWSVTDILTASSNVGTINIAARLGKTKLDSYLRRFGFGSRTDLHLPGESAGLLLDPKHWYPTSIATVPIGQGVAVTALQILAAYNTVANGGVYVAPKLVKAVVDPSGHTIPTPPSPTHQVVSAQTAQEMTAMLSEVVRTGTATAAGIDGYTVSGKTGTARKAIEGQRGYEAGAYISSFAGFVPAEHPAFTALVVLDQPTPIFGGLVAAPVFAQMSRYALREMVVPPPASDPHLFDGVPHAVASAATVLGDPGGAQPPGSQPLAVTPLAPLVAPTSAPAGAGPAVVSGPPSTVAAPLVPPSTVAPRARITTTTVIPGHPPPTGLQTGPATPITGSPPTTLTASPNRRSRVATP